jgi:AAA15 family ATPase/GTPase
MNVRSLIIENLRGFTSRNEVMFTDPDVAVFVGVNGSGKSTILEAIFTSFYPLSVFSEINNIGEWSYFTGKDISNGSTASFIEMQFGLSAGSNEEHSVLSVGNVMSGFQIQNEYASQTKSLQDFLVNSLVTGLELPILAFYKNSSPIRLQKKGSSEYANFNIRQQAYQEALRLSVDFDSIENFYKNLLNLQNSEVISKKQWNYKLPAVETFNQGITAFLDKLEGDSNTPGFIDFSVKEFNQVISYSMVRCRFKPFVAHDS